MNGFTRREAKGVSQSWAAGSLARASAFEETLRERCAERIVPFRFGRALFNDSYPRVWDLNVLRVEHPEGATAELLVAEADRLHAEAGHHHRRVTVLDERLGDELAARFTTLGWRTDCFVFMAYEGRGERVVETASVREAEPSTLRRVREEIARTEPWATDDEVVRMVLEAADLVARQGRARHFAAFVGSEAASVADLYSDGRTAQVEDVATRPRFRNRGLASAVVLRAVEEAIAAGHDFVFLIADAADWPRELYTRLGFAPLGSKWAFLRQPV